MSDQPLIPEAWGSILAREALIPELSLAMSPAGSFFPTEEGKKRATAFVDKLEAEGKLYEFLESTMPEPCPTCGHLPGW